MSDKVLMVMPPPVARAMIEKIRCADAGLEIITASCPEKGLVTWEKFLAEGDPFPIVITARYFDEGFPLDPWEMIRAIRAACPKTKIIAPTMVNPEVEMRAFQRVDPLVITFAMTSRDHYHLLVETVMASN